MQHCTANSRQSSSMSYKDESPIRTNGTVPSIEVDRTENVATPEGALVNRMQPIVRMLQFLGYFPGCQNLTGGKGTIFQLFSLVAFGINAMMFAYNIKIARDYKNIFGAMHAFTICAIITGIKPLINVGNIGVFMINFKKHKKMLKLLELTDAAFRSDFGASPPVSNWNLAMLLEMTVSFFVPLTLIICQTVVTGTRLGVNFLDDSSLILVPFLSLWNLLPLFYYEYINRIVCFWCDRLRSTIGSDLFGRHPKHEMGFYYDYFYSITCVQKSVGDLFNPFILFSVGWALATLCMTIYFGTYAGPAVDEPPYALESIEDRDLWRVQVTLIILWSALQIAISLGYIVIICYTGTKTNETSRTILATVLRPQRTTDFDNFELEYFVHKTASQDQWGMSVWRFFPLERSVFFTLVSLIVTYSFLLFKIKGTGDHNETKINNGTNSANDA